MRPLYWEGRFGWVHADGSAARGVGVVICSAFGQEEVCTHYGVMALADQLAQAGMPTVRFDYRATGDSIPGEPTLASMREDIVAAAAMLRQETGVRRVILLGIRLGALLALQAQDDIPGVGALALVAPVLRGRAFIRETRAAASVASLSGLEPVQPIESDRPLIANGFAWPAALQRGIADIDLSGVTPPAMPMLVVAARTDRHTPKIAESWSERGAAIKTHPFPDYDLWMQDPTTNETPNATFAEIVRWCTTCEIEAQPLPDTGAKIAIADTLALEQAVEEPIRFGKNDALFGILTRPANGKAASVAALLMHEGSTHHIGNGGAYVRLARELAASGIASLRMDLTGMGDSPAGDNPRHPHYDPERIVEGVAGMEALAANGFDEAVVFGLCSGAHTALQVALSDRRIVGAMMLNLQKFIWHYGDDVRVAVRDNKRSLKGYLRAMRNPGEWRRALSGNADLRGIARVLAKRGAARGAHMIRSLLPVRAGSETAQVRGQMRDLSERGVHAAFVFSDEDPGLAEMWTQFGRGARRLNGYAPARMVVLDRADHHFNAQDARRRQFAIARDMLLDLAKARQTEADHKAVTSNTDRIAA